MNCSFDSYDHNTLNKGRSNQDCARRSHLQLMSGHPHWLLQAKYNAGATSKVVHRLQRSEAPSSVGRSRTHRAAMTVRSNRVNAHFTLVKGRCLVPEENGTRKRLGEFAQGAWSKQSAQLRWRPCTRPKNHGSQVGRGSLRSCPGPKATKGPALSPAWTALWRHC
jgi:hypothetical protein